MIYFAILAVIYSIIFLVYFSKKYSKKHELLIKKDAEYILEQKTVFYTKEIYFTVYDINWVLMRALSILKKKGMTKMKVNDIKISFLVNDKEIFLSQKKNVLRVLNGLRKYESKKFNRFIDETDIFDNEFFKNIFLEELDNYNE